MGSNPAENHPISFKWVLKAQDKGAKVVSVDPRFTHSSSKADFYVQLRVGTDIAFLGGMINYILNSKYIPSIHNLFNSNMDTIRHIRRNTSIDNAAII